VFTRFGLQTASSAVFYKREIMMSFRRSRPFFCATFCLALLAPRLLMAIDSPVEDSAELFNNFDSNRDGALSTAEIGAYSWARYDSDADGQVSRAEFLAGRMSDRSQAATDTDLEKAWRFLDWNKDGVLSGTELDGKWLKFDADGNGVVSKAEFIQGRTNELQPAPVVAPGGITWTAISVLDKGFTFQMPGKPEQDKDGNYSLTFDNGNTIFKATIMQSDEDLEATASTRLDAGRDAEVEAVKGKLLSERTVMLEGHPGRAFTVQIPGDDEIEVRYRMFIVGKRLCELVAITSANAETSPATINRFFNSLKLAASVPQNPQGGNFGYADFLDIVSNADGQRLFDQMHPDLQTEVDLPVMQLFLDAVKAKLGAMTDDKLADLKTAPTENAGEKTEATVRFARGSATCRVTLEKNQIIGFMVDSDDLADVGDVMYGILLSDPTGDGKGGAYRKLFASYYGPVSERLIRAVLGGKDQEAYDCFPAVVKKIFTFEQGQAKFQSARNSCGSLKQLDYDGLTVVLNSMGKGESLSMNYKLQCDTGKVDGQVSLKFAGLKAVVTGYELTSNQQVLP
jgi:hypothetical protein